MQFLPLIDLLNGLDSKQRQELLLKIGEISEEARVLSQRDYAALGGGQKLGSRDT